MAINQSNYLFIDSTNKAIYSIPLQEVLNIIEYARDTVNKKYAPTAYIPHLPVGFTNYVYYSAYIGEINIKDYINGRYIIIEDTPTSRVLYGQPDITYTSLLSTC